MIVENGQIIDVHCNFKHRQLFESILHKISHDGDLKLLDPNKRLYKPCKNLLEKFRIYMIENRKDEDKSDDIIRPDSNQIPYEQK